MDRGAVVVPAPATRQQSRRGSMIVATNNSSRLCNCVVKEIIATERQYVSDLRDIHDGYMACAKGVDLLSATDIHDIFGNIDAIYNFNSSFLSDIESCCEDPVRTATCFLTRSEEFGVYAAYCTNYSRSQATLSYVLARPVVHELFRRQQDFLGHSLPVSAYLHKPVQRVLKYPLLLQNLLKYYDGQGDGRRCIEAALQSIREVANHINETKRASEHALKAQQLLGDVGSPQDECDGANFGPLLMVGDFRLHGAKSYRHLFLFEKAVILAKRRDGDSDVQYRKTIIKGCDLMLIESVPKEPLCFQLIHYRSPRKLYALQAKSVDEKRAWCIGIKRLMIESLPGAIPDRSKQLLLSTGLEQATGGSDSAVLSPLADGVPPMSSLAAVAAAAAAAATSPPARHPWLKSPNLLLKSQARHVPDYLERRRRKGLQFRSYIDLSHFVRKHLARRSDGALSSGAYSQSVLKQSAARADLGNAPEESADIKSDLSPSEQSFAIASPLCRWGSGIALVRSRSLGSLDMEGYRTGSVISSSKASGDSSYDDCCSRAHSLARLLTENGVDGALMELAGVAWDSHFDHKLQRGKMKQLRRRSGHRQAFHGRQSSEMQSPEEEQVCDISDTCSAFTDSSVGDVGAADASKASSAEAWPVLRRNGTASSDEGYVHGPSDCQFDGRQGDLSNRCSGIDFSSPSRCSVASSESGSSTNDSSDGNDPIEEGSSYSPTRVVDPVEQSGASDCANDSTDEEASHLSTPTGFGSVEPCGDIGSESLELLVKAHLADLPESHSKCDKVELNQPALPPLASDHFAAASGTANDLHEVTLKTDSAIDCCIDTGSLNCITDNGAVGAEPLEKKDAEQTAKTVKSGYNACTGSICTDPVVTVHQPPQSSIQSAKREPLAADSSGSGCTALSFRPEARECTPSLEQELAFDHLVAKPRPALHLSRGNRVTAAAGRARITAVSSKLWPPTPSTGEAAGQACLPGLAIIKDEKQSESETRQYVTSHPLGWREQACNSTAGNRGADCPSAHCSASGCVYCTSIENGRKTSLSTHEVVEAKAACTNPTNQDAVEATVCHQSTGPNEVSRSVIRLARQYSTKIKDRPARAAVPRGDAAHRPAIRKAQHPDSDANVNASGLQLSGNYALMSLLECDLSAHEDARQERGKSIDIVAADATHAPAVLPVSARANSSCAATHPARPAECSVHQECTTTCDQTEPDQRPLARCPASESAQDARCHRSTGRTISAALRERMRSLERPPIEPRVFTYSDVDCQQVDSLKDRIRMLQTSGAAAVPADGMPNRSRRGRELTPPVPSSKVTKAPTKPLGRCLSLPSENKQATVASSGLHSAVVARVSSKSAATAGKGRSSVPPTEDATAVTSGYVRNIVQKFQVH